MFFHFFYKNFLAWDLFLLKISSKDLGKLMQNICFSTLGIIAHMY